jgi:hypothetical protein
MPNSGFNFKAVACCSRTSLPTHAERAPLIQRHRWNYKPRDILGLSFNIATSFQPRQRGKLKPEATPIQK